MKYPRIRVLGADQTVVSLEIQPVQFYRFMEEISPKEFNSNSWATRRIQSLIKLYYKNQNLPHYCGYCNCYLADIKSAQISYITKKSTKEILATVDRYCIPCLNHAGIPIINEQYLLQL